MRSDLTIVDSEFLDVGKEFEAFWIIMRDALDEYYVRLDVICKYDIASGATHEKLCVFTEYVPRVVEGVKVLSERSRQISTTFIEKIDRADRFLYETGIDSVRLFTSDEKKKLLDLVKDPWSSVTDQFGDWIYSFVLKLAIIKKVKEYLQKCHRFLLDYNDVVKADIVEIFNSANEIDRQYGWSTPMGDGSGNDFYTCYFKQLSYATIRLQVFLRELSDCITGLNYLSVGEIRARINAAYMELEKSIEDLPEIVLDKDPDLSAIERFVAKVWAYVFFDGFQSVDDMFWADNEGWESCLKEVVFNTMDATKTVIRKDPLADDVLDVYKRYKTKEIMLASLKELAEVKDYKSTETSSYINSAKTFVDYIKKYGENWKDKLKEDGLWDGRTKEAKEWDAMLEDLGGIKKFLKYGNETVEYLYDIFCDYSYGLELIESQRKITANNEMVDSALDEIESLYKREWGGVKSEALDRITELGLEAGMKAMGEVNIAMKIINTIDEGIDKVGEVTGWGEQGESIFNARLYKDICESSENAYKETILKFSNMSPEDEDYETVANDVKNTFIVHKQNMVKKYETMANASTGEKKSYYRYCAKMANNLDMWANGAPRIMPFDEYLSTFKA